MSKPISNADYIPVSEPTPIVSFSPVVLSMPGREVDLHMRVSVPATGRDPLLLFSHGHGTSNYLSLLRG